MSAPPVIGPADLPDLRTWLLDQWRPGRPFAEVAGPHHHQRSVAANEHPVSYTRWEVANISQATLWWVSEDMVDVLMAALPSMPEDVRLSDLPRPANAGLVVFAKPWIGLDAVNPENPVTVDAMVWGTANLPRLGAMEAGLALGLSSYRRVDFGEGLSPGELRLALATGAFTHATEHVMTMTDGKLAANLTGSSWVPLGRSDWPYPQPLGAASPLFDEASALSMIEDRRVIASLWTLLAQSAVSTTTTQTAPRPARRRAERVGIHRDLSDVRVVTLRRPVAAPTAVSADPGGGRHQRVRCVVSAHFCWQPHGPGRTLRKLIVRGPYVRGPADAPLHAPKVVRAWVR